MIVGLICVSKGAEEELHSTTLLFLISFIVTSFHVGGSEGRGHGDRAVSVSEVGKRRIKHFSAMG